jgi:uncharacterized membrane protein YfcA
MSFAGEWAALSAPAALLLGAWAGLSGYSGWPLAVPLLLVFVGRPLHESLAASLLIDWVNAAAASAVYALRGDADRASASRFALAGLPFVLLGVAVSFTLLQRFEHLVARGAGPVSMALGLALVARTARLRSGAAMLAVAGPGAGVALEHAPSPGLSEAARRRLLGAGMALTAGAMGLVGMGGGFTAALLLILVRGDDTRAGVATGLLFTALVLPLALLAYLLLLPEPVGIWDRLLPFAGWSALGAGLAAAWGARIPSRHLGFVVGAGVLLAGLAATLQRGVLG